MWNKSKKAVSPLKPDVALKVTRHDMSTDTTVFLEGSHDQAVQMITLIKLGAFRW